MGNRNSLNVMTQRGQSTVEYILLLAVVIALMVTVFNSTPFQNLIGQNGSFAKAIKGEVEWNYRYASPGRQVGAAPIRYTGSTHPSYFNQAKGQSRFFGPRNKYPP